jgi:RNA-directed DNA polymerase
MEVDHVLPQAYGGTDRKDNLQLLHRHCHARKTARDFRCTGTSDKRHVAEEPCESKLSCTVLEPSGGGDPAA